jgi:hypothetical protein
VSHIRRPAFAPFLLAFLMAAVAVPVGAVPVQAAGNAEFLRVANAYRADAGVPPVGANAVIEAIAVERADAIAKADKLTHDLDLVGRKLDAAGLCWRGMGEIIAYNSTGSIERFGEQWFNSKAGHKEIMLGSGYTHAGGSWTKASSGRYYAAMIFVQLCGSGSGGFTDVGSSAFRNEIGWLVAANITAGCTADRYCPKSSVTREQMASFLRRVTGVPALTSGWFTDVSASIHRADINGVAAAKIAAGCTDSRYCPSTKVTRGQMASFLARALNLPATTRDYFSDDNGTLHEGAINSLAAAGITGGCAAGRFCPNDSVTREQMAGFLYRAFGR